MKNRIISILKDAKLDSDAFINKQKAHIKALKETFDEDMMNEKIELLQQVARDYNLDFTELTNRYVKKKGGKLADVFDEQDAKLKKEILEQANLYSGNLWNTVDYEGETYFVELLENGKVLNKYQNCVGKVVDGNIIFDKIIMNKLLETHDDDYDTTDLNDPNNYILMDEYVRHNLYILENGNK